MSTRAALPAQRSARVAAAMVALTVALTVAVAVAAAACSRDGAADGADPAVAGAVRRSKASNPAAWKRKVILLGFDSCDPDLLDQLIREGKLPHFARMRREGASGILESIQPVLSPVVWTTIATGMPPERHGILDFVTETSGGLVPVSSKMRAADTVWDVLSRHGETIGVVGWLVTYPAEPVNGFVVTDRMGLLAFDYGREMDTEAPLRTWPEDLAKEIEASRVTVDDLTLSSVRPFADVSQAEFAAAYSTRFHPLNRLGNLRLTMATAETFRGAGERLLAERRPRFFATYFEAMDAISHLFMRYAPPKLPDVDEQEYLRYRTAIEANYVWHDRVLGEYMDLADDDTTIFLVSDHGFKSGAFRRGDPSDFHAKTGAMWHRQYGVFLAWGDGIDRGVRVDGATVFDIAPTVLAAMGYPAPKDMPGRVLTAAFEGGLPHESVPTYFGESRRDRLAAEGLVAKNAAADLTPEQQAELERMASLGYISGDRKDPANTHMNLGQRFMVTGRFADALEQFQSALKRQRTPGALCASAEALLCLGRTDDAAAAVAEAVGLDPSDVMARLLSARVHMAKGESEQAELLARAVVSDKPDLPMTHGTLAWILEARGTEAERAGDAKTAASRRAEALALHEAAIRLEPNQIPSRLAAANLILENAADVDSIPRALDHLDRVVQLRPEHVVAWNARAVALLRLGMHAQRQGRADDGGKRLAEALTSATRAVDAWRTRTGKEYAKGWANSAYALWRLDRMDDALAAALKARATDPSYGFAPPFVTAIAASGRTLPPPEPAPTK